MILLGIIVYLGLLLVNTCKFNNNHANIFICQCPSMITKIDIDNIMPK